MGSDQSAGCSRPVRYLSRNRILKPLVLLWNISQFIQDGGPFVLRLLISVLERQFLVIENYSNFCLFGIQALYELGAPQLALLPLNALGFLSSEIAEFVL